MRNATTISLWLALCGAVGVLATPVARAGIIEGINHTHLAINKFSVDGWSALDTIGPWQRGGGGRFSLPSRWTPGMTVQVDWQTGGSGIGGFPGLADWPKAVEWRAKVIAQRRDHSRAVLVPSYAEQSTCGITVHFLPCDEIQVATSCYAYGHPEYPIKTPLKLPEPQSCPATDHLPAQGALR